jgi:hypothetical protein
VNAANAGLRAAFVASAARQPAAEASTPHGQRVVRY